MTAMQGLCDSVAPSPSGSPSGPGARVARGVGAKGRLIGGHPDEVSKPLDPLLLNVVQDRCCLHSVSDNFIPDPVSPGLVGCSSEASHLTGDQSSLLGFGQRPGLALVCEGGDEDSVYKFGFCGHGNVGVTKEGGKLIADGVGFLAVALIFPVHSPVMGEDAVKVWNHSDFVW